MHISSVNMVIDLLLTFTIAIRYEVAYMGFRLAYFDLTLAYSKSHLGHRNSVLPNFWPCCLSLDAARLPKLNCNLLSGLVTFM